METHSRYRGRAGAAWSSSVRGLSCSVKSGNERNPHRVLQVSRETARPFVYNQLIILYIKGWEEGEDDARSAWPLMPWAARMIQWVGQRDAIG